MRGLRGGDKREDAAACNAPDPVTRIRSDTKAKKYGPSEPYRDHKKGTLETTS